MLVSILYLIRLIGYSLPDNTAATNISYLVQQTIKQKLGYGEMANHPMLKVEIPISEILFVFVLDLVIFVSCWKYRQVHGTFH